MKRLACILIGGVFIGLGAHVLEVPPSVGFAQKLGGSLPIVFGGLIAAVIGNDHE